MSIVQTAPPDSDESDDEREQSPKGDPCPHCEPGFLSVDTNEDGEIVEVYCKQCHMDIDGNLSLPEVGEVPTGYEYPWDEYETYRVSKKMVMRGAYPAIDTDDTYGLDDDSASYSKFVS